MALFAKLFDTPHGQLLVTKDFNDEDSDAPYRIECRGEGSHAADPFVSFGWDNGAERDAEFDSTDQCKADTIAAELVSMSRNVLGSKDDSE